jgi:DNA-binding LacI/PurR family transcriptional regulator
MLYASAMTNPAPGRVTIHEVAKRAKVSPSTVSLVLNGKNDRMRADTFERVMKAVEELGYAANQMARGLKMGFVPTIGLVVPTVANPFWGEFARCVEHAAMAKNYQVLLCNAERIPEREQRYVESMLSRGIRGVILGSSPLSLKHLAGVTKRGLQVVAFDRLTLGEPGVELDSVRVDNVAGAKLAVSHLLELGHRRIGFVSGSLSSASRKDRLEGYRSTLLAAGIEPDPGLIWTENGNPDDGDEEATEIGRTAALTLLKRTDRPTAFFAINDMTAVGIYAGVHELGLQIPQDVSVVGFDDIHLCKIMNPPVTTMRQPLEELMHRAVNLLIGRMEGVNHEAPVHLTLPTELVVRGSTAGKSKDLVSPRKTG